MIEYMRRKVFGRLDMERLGYMHDILDVKILILFVTARVDVPVDAQTIYEFCLQDDALSYFDVQESIPQLVASGHLEVLPEDRYLITQKGRLAEEVTSDSLPFTVRERARVAVERYNQELKRSQYLRSEINRKEDGEYLVDMELHDMRGQLMKLTLTAPSMQQARRLETAYRKNAELVYQSVMIGLLGEPEYGDTEN